MALPEWLNNWWSFVKYIKIGLGGCQLGLLASLYTSCYSAASQPCAEATSLSWTNYARSSCCRVWNYLLESSMVHGHICVAFQCMEIHNYLHSNLYMIIIGLSNNDLCSNDVWNMPIHELCTKVDILIWFVRRYLQYVPKFALAVWDTTNHNL